MSDIIPHVILNIFISIYEETVLIEGAALQLPKKPKAQDCCLFQRKPDDPLNSKTIFHDSEQPLPYQDVSPSLKRSNG